MDSGRGEFHPIDPTYATEMEKLRRAGAKLPSVFQVGEVVDIKNSQFKIVTIGDQFMRLKLLPKGLSTERRT